MKNINKTKSQKSGILQGATKNNGKLADPGSITHKNQEMEVAEADLDEQDVEAVEVNEEEVMTEEADGSVAWDETQEDSDYFSDDEEEIMDKITMFAQ